MNCYMLRTDLKPPAILKQAGLIQSQLASFKSGWFLATGQKSVAGEGGAAFMLELYMYERDDCESIMVMEEGPESAFCVPFCTLILYTIPSIQLT